MSWHSTPHTNASFQQRAVGDVISGVLLSALVFVLFIVAA